MNGLESNNGRRCIDRQSIEAQMREYMKNGGSFVFMKFSRLTCVSYEEALEVSSYFSPYANKKFNGRSIVLPPGINTWPIGAIAALAAVCTMEGNRRQGNAI